MSEDKVFTHLPTIGELKAVSEKIDERVAEEILNLASSWSSIELLDKDQEASQDYELSLVNEFVGLLQIGHKWDDIRWQGTVNWLGQLQRIIQDMKIGNLKQ